MSADIDIHHLAAAYALDAVDERERAAFEAHYPSCEVCHADVLDFRATLTELAAGSAAAPPPALRDRVLAEIAQTRQLSPLLPAAVTELAERRRRRQRTIGGLLAVAAVAVAFVAGAVVVRNGSSAYEEALASVMEQDDARMVSLVAQDGASVPGSVRVAWSAASGTVVVMGDGLPAAPSGHAYEVWMMDDEGPHAMQVLQQAGDGELRAVLDMDAVPAAFGVTIEPESGAATPSGDLVFMAEV